MRLERSLLSSARAVNVISAELPLGVFGTGTCRCGSDTPRRPRPSIARNAMIIAPTPNSSDVLGV